MASTCTLKPLSNSIHLPRANTLKHLDVTRPQLSFNRPPRRQRRRFSLQALAPSAAVTVPINMDYLVREFSGHGVSFESIGESCVVEMALDNGSLAKLMLPSGLITSYKPFMWHGTTLEVLHTTVSEGEDGEAVIQGGVSMDFKCINDGGMPWSPSNWTLRNVSGSSDKSIQIELGSAAPENMAEFKCVVTLRHNLLASEFTVINRRSSSLQLLGCVMNHLTVSTPDATYAVGLQGSNYHGRRPINTEFSIIPPDSDKKISSTSGGESWAQKAVRGLFSSWETRDGMKDEAVEEDSMIEESEGEEADDYAHMTEEMCRIYMSAPREFTVIDRGRRNSVAVGRSGFDDIYVLSPGSKHDWYGKYAYICIGPTMQTPVSLAPGGTWKGAQYLHNPNL
ncbi:protein NDH-DEPENDENT CYCLIC ELECTRON FLOW 5-like [Ananas comosus]|uniref:Protein NDH-DEPENDENT CYCLIC ELECTRON FLOW 5-like n=1 Tax=Ananas comosus TaxID=4615 RepID=A0A6P5FXQ5_ANACO|nr:protein NDH-DEPENDENT CYCLIC ELECTRON FLOW 5-like [Ananas comosus]